MERNTDDALTLPHHSLFWPLSQWLLPFFKLVGWVATTADEVKPELCAFNNRALVRDLEEICRIVNVAQVSLPDGRRLMVAIGERFHAYSDAAPLASAD